MGLHIKRRAAWALEVFLCLLAGAACSGGAASAQGIDTSGFTSRVLTLLNQERAASGLPALHRVGPLDNAAQAYSEAMMRATAGGPVYLSHTSPDGTSFSDRISRAGYGNWTALGENIAAGQRSPEEVVSGWMNSPGHRANILNGAFRDIGIGLAVGPGTWPGGYTDPNVIWWTTDFGSSTASYSSDPGPAPPPAPSRTPQPAPDPAPSPTPDPTPTTNPGPTPPTDVPAPGPFPRRTLSVTAFGAWSDGSANATPAIQAAIDTARPGDAVYFAAGTYRLDGPLFVRKSHVTLWGEGAASVLQHGNHPGLQLGSGTGALEGLVASGLRFVGLPNKYRADGNTAEAITVTGAIGALISDCDFQGSGIAVRDAGEPGTPSGTRLRDCRVQGWGTVAFVLAGGDRVENCSLLQDDPDRSAGRSGSALRIPAGSIDIQVTDTAVVNARAAAIQIDGSGSGAVTSEIQLQRLTLRDCWAGIALLSGSSGTAPTRNVAIEACSILGAYGGPALSVKQGDGIDIRKNQVDGGSVGLELGNWGPAEPPGAVINLRAEGNAIRNCDRGIAARASNGGSFANVALVKNALANCRVPLDIAGVPGISLQ